MKENKPLKRAKEMQPYSKDHHHGLLLGWKLRAGLKKGVAIDRLCTYTMWFYKTHLAPHFLLEEKYLFPVLGMEHELIKKAVSEHRQIGSLIALPCDQARLMQLADLLEAHIRFEERELFGQIQSSASREELDRISAVHGDQKFTEHPDEFWK